MDHSDPKRVNFAAGYCAKNYRFYIQYTIKKMFGFQKGLYIASCTFCDHPAQAGEEICSVEEVGGVLLIDQVYILPQIFIKWQNHSPGLKRNQITIFF